MARQLLVLALVLVAFLGFTSADDAANAPLPMDDLASAADNTIGAIDDAAGPAGDDAVGGPVGGPVPAGAFPPSHDGQDATAPSASGAAALKVSTVAAVAAAAGYFF